jgi:hypothetical protein
VQKVTLNFRINSFSSSSSSSLPVAPTLERRAFVTRFVSLQFLNLRQSVGLLGRVISPSQGRYLTQTDIHALNGTRTHGPSIRAAEDISCLRPRGHYDRHFASIRILKQVRLQCCFRSVGSIVPGPRHHNQSWFRVPPGHIFVLSGLLRVLKWDVHFDEGRADYCWSVTHPLMLMFCKHIWKKKRKNKAFLES